MYYNVTHLDPPSQALHTDRDDVLALTPALFLAPPLSGKVDLSQRVNARVDAGDDRPRFITAYPR